MELKSYERKSAGTLLTLNGIALIALSLLGPLFTQRIRYATSPSGIFQMMGQDAVNLFIFGPLFAVGGILYWTGKRIGPYVTAMAAVFLLYFGLTVGIGMEWSDVRYVGNSEQAFALFLFFFISGLVLSVVTLTEFGRMSMTSMPPKVMIPYSVVFALFILLFAGMWISEISEVLRTGTARGYDEAPTIFWVIRFLDLGLSIPLALFSLYLLWTRPDSSPGIQMLLYGFFITMIISVNAMGLTMAAKGDADYIFSQQLVFLGIACIIFWGYGLIVRSIHEPKPNEPNSASQDLIQAVFTLSRLWERVFDRAFRPDGISVKQFFLMAVIDRAFESPPTLGDAAKVLKMSYQNVKKLALQLENKGMLELRQDERDRRILRLHKTPANEEYWKNRTPGDSEGFNALFHNVSIIDMKTALSTISKLAENAESASMA